MTCCIILSCFMIIFQGLSRTGKDHFDELSTVRHEYPSNYKFIQVLVFKHRQTIPAPLLAQRSQTLPVFDNFLSSGEETGHKLRLRFPPQRVGAIQPRHAMAHYLGPGILPDLYSSLCFNQEMFTNCRTLSETQTAMSLRIDSHTCYRLQRPPNYP